MKLATIDNSVFIILDSRKDVEIYKAINEQIKAKQSINLYFGFKSQNFRDSITQYASHEVESNNSMAHVMSVAVELNAFAKRSNKVSLTEYCILADNIINRIHTTMLQMIHEGKKIRVNIRGGFCSLLFDDTISTETEINELELHNYLLHGEIDVNFKITGKTIVIENDKYIPKELIKQYLEVTSADSENLQVITSFKQKTLLFNNVDWFNFFRLGIKEGLKNIVFETTSQDKRQLTGIRDILQTLPNNNKPFNIYVKGWQFEKMLPTFDYDANKLNIIILK